MCAPNLEQIGTYLDIEMTTQLNRSQNDQIIESLTHKLLDIPLMGRHETPRKKISAQSEKIT